VRPLLLFDSLRGEEYKQSVGKMTCCGMARCGSVIPATKMFCEHHWKVIPPPIQDEIYEAYRSKDRIRSLELCMEVNRAYKGTDAS
jgi:hypothetical protein